MGKTLIPTHSGEEVFFLLVFLTVVSCVDVASKDLFLPTSHLPYHSSLDKKCWGYEPECHHDHSFSQNFTECSQTQDRSKFYDEAGRVLWDCLEDYSNSPSGLVVATRVDVFLPASLGRSRLTRELRCSSSSWDQKVTLVDIFAKFMKP